MRTANMNVEDPAAQEKVRREPHEFRATEGKHGAYFPRPYVHQEYPKMMLNTPKPELKQFRLLPNPHEAFDLAVKEWDAAMSASVVRNLAEEKRWLRANAS